MAKTLVISCTRAIKNAKHFATPEDLEDYLATHENYDTLLFVIWHWKVLATLLNNYRCIGMHTGPLLQGKGRGPSPIKNLRKAGICWATLCSFEMTENFDEGEVFTAVPIDLRGTEAEIYKQIDDSIPILLEYLAQEQKAIPEVWTRTY